MLGEWIVAMLYTIIYDVGISFCTTVNLGLIANSDNKSNPKTTANNIYTYKYLLRYCGYLKILEIARNQVNTDNSKTLYLACLNVERNQVIFYIK